MLLWIDLTVMWVLIDDVGFDGDVDLTVRERRRKKRKKKKKETTKKR